MRPQSWCSSARRAVEGAERADLVRYALSLPGVTCAVTGIGHIDRERPEADQLVANLAAGVSDMPSPEERLRIEKDVAERQGKDTNYFQGRTPSIVQPTGVTTQKDGDRVEVRWNTAIASADPIRSYEVRAGEKVLLSLPYRPQLTEEPFKATVAAAEVGSGPITVIASTAEPRARAWRILLVLSSTPAPHRAGRRRGRSAVGLAQQ